MQPVSAPLNRAARSMAMSPLSRTGPARMVAGIAATVALVALSALPPTARLCVTESRSLSAATKATSRFAAGTGVSRWERSEAPQATRSGSALPSK